MHLVLARVLALVIAGLAGWLVQQVPTLDPAQAEKVASVLVNHWWSAILMALTAGWVFFRRPGDAPASLPSAAVFHLPGHGPGGPGDKPGERR